MCMLCKTIPVGNVLFVIQHRGDQENGGAALSLLVEVATPEPNAIPRLVTVWRADCFMRDPHQHFFGASAVDDTILYQNWFARLPEHIEGITKPEPATFDGSVEPFMERLLNIAGIITETGYQATIRIDQEAITAASGQIQKWMTLAQNADAFAEALLR